jgi:hypothetical protein
VARRGAFDARVDRQIRAANLVAVFLTTVLVTRFVDAKSPLGRIGFFATASVIALLGAYLLALATSIREVRFPKSPTSCSQ